MNPITLVSRILSPLALRSDLRPVVREKIDLPVMSFSPDTWEYRWPRGKFTAQVDFTAEPSPVRAFYREYQPSKVVYSTGIAHSELFLREAGAYVLSNLLKLDVVPETLLADLSGQHDQRIRSLGSLQQGVEGGSVKKGRTGTPIADKLLEQVATSNDSLAQLYVYTVVAYDWDKGATNVYVDKLTNRLKSIDNELSGSDPEGAQRPIDLPVRLQPYINNQPLPDSLMTALSDFVKNGEQNMDLLRPYYPVKSIRAMFHRAQVLLDTGRMEPLDELNAKL